MGTSDLWVLAYCLSKIDFVKIGIFSGGHRSTDECYYGYDEIDLEFKYLH